MKLLSCLNLKNNDMVISVKGFTCKCSNINYKLKQELHGPHCSPEQQ